MNRTYFSYVRIRSIHTYINNEHQPQCIQQNMTFISLPLLCIVILLAVYLIYQRLCYFSKRSIPCPPIPSIFLGHLSTLWSVKSFSEQLREWTEKYGSVYGLFEGLRPMFVTSDVAFIEEVFIKQFARFPSRRRVFVNRFLGVKRSNVFSTHLISVWKKQRKILQPVFSGSKMKRLLPTVDSCVHMFMEKLAEIPDDTTIDMYELYKRMTMDIICRCAFSIDTDVQNDVDNKNIYMRKVSELFAHDSERMTLAKLHRLTSHTLFAHVSLILFHVQRMLTTKQSSIPANLWLLEHMHDFIEQRLHGVKTTRSTDDVIELLADAVHSNKDQLSPTELLSNVFIVLVAGFETTSTALAFCTYRLAIHQDLQQELYEELLQQESCDHESVAKLPAMDLFVREVLRMHPPVPEVIQRQCVEDTHVAGYDIRKDTLVQVDVLSVHYNQDLWGPEPVDEFYPTRHLQKRHPAAFIPFGAGPRICLGMSFALMEIKLCLAQMLTTYRVVPPSSDGYKLDIREGITRAPVQVCIKLEKRTTSVI